MTWVKALSEIVPRIDKGYALVHQQRATDKLNIIQTNITKFILKLSFYFSFTTFTAYIGIFLSLKKLRTLIKTNII